MSARVWRMARSLGATAEYGLLGEINRSAPGRNRASDGGIGDAAHARRTSDHNPCHCHHVVCARDFTHDPKKHFDSYAFAEWLRRRVVDGVEHRVKYVISNGRIFSGHGQTHPVGVWRTYTGNPHSTHVHVGVRHPPKLFDDTHTWGWPPTLEIGPKEVPSDSS
jgi:hypothetical protein